MKASLKRAEGLTNGNFVICYTPVTYRNTLWIFLIPLVISLIVLVVILIFYTKIFTLLISPILAMFLIWVVLYWIESTEKQNDDLILFATRGFISQHAEKAIKQMQPMVKELRRSYEVIDDGKYGIIKEQYIRVVLSNGKALRFDIVRDKAEDKLRVLKISSSYTIIE